MTLVAINLLLFVIFNSFVQQGKDFEKFHTNSHMNKPKVESMYVVNFSAFQFDFPAYSQFFFVENL